MPVLFVAPSADTSYLVILGIADHVSVMKYLSGWAVIFSGAVGSVILFIAVLSGVSSLAPFLAFALIV